LDWNTVFVALFSLTFSIWASAFNCADGGSGVYQQSLYVLFSAWNSHIGEMVFFGFLNLIISPTALFHIRRSVSKQETQERSAFLIGTYHPAFFFWEIVVALKKVLIFFSLSFEAYKYLLAVFSQFVFAFIETLLWPYKADEANRLNIKSRSPTF
jgi:hypothetical protein